MDHHYKGKQTKHFTIFGLNVKQWQFFLNGKDFLCYFRENPRTQRYSTSTDNEMISKNSSK